MNESRPFADDEVSLQQYVDVVRRRRWTILQTMAIVFVLGCVVTALTPPVYEAGAKLLVRATAPQINALDTENPLVDLLAMAQPESVETQIEVLRTEPFLAEVFAALRVPQNEREPQVRVRAVKDTNVIEVSVQTPDRRLAARVANTMLERYLERTQVLSLHEITLARAFVEKQSEKAHGALQRAEAALVEFRRKNRVAELTAEQQNRTQQFMDLEAKSSEARDNILRLQAQMREVRAQLARQPRERLVSVGQKNPDVTAVQAKLAQLRVERAISLELYESDSRTIRTFDAQIATLQSQLAREPLEERVPLHMPNERYDKLLDRLDGYQTELEGLQVLSTRLEAQLRQKRQRLNQLGPWEIRLVQLQRDRDMAEKSYLNLANKLQDLQIRENARRSTARIIEHAVPPLAPIRPRRVVNLVLSLLLGTLLGCCFAFVLESLDDRISSAEDVDRLLALPVLGHIPILGDEHRLISSLPPHSPVAESYRGLRASINFSAVDTTLSTLAVTSAHAGEGKSTTAANLAMAMANDGRRVILVDTDLRRPNLHRLLGSRSSPGVTDVLTGQCLLDEALQPIGDYPLYLLASGPIPPNPAEMLNTAGMDALIHQLRERADVVIFDTPPCVPISDAQVLGTKLEAIVLVVEAGETRKGEIRRARELMERARIRVLGVVLTKIRQKDGGHYYRYAYYHSDPASNGHASGRSLRRRAEVSPIDAARGGRSTPGVPPGVDPAGNPGADLPLASTSRGVDHDPDL